MSKHLKITRSELCDLLAVHCGPGYKPGEPNIIELCRGFADNDYRIMIAFDKANGIICRIAADHGEGHCDYVQGNNFAEVVGLCIARVVTKKRWELVDE